MSPTAASWCHCGNTDGFGGFGLGQERLEGCRGGSSTRPRFFPIPGRKHQSYGVVKWYFLVTVLSIIDLKILLQFVCIDFKTFIFSAQMRTIHFPIHGPHICLHPDSPSRTHHQQWHSKRSEPNFSSPQLRWGSAHNLHKCIPELWSFKKKKKTQLHPQTITWKWEHSISPFSKIKYFTFPGWENAWPQNMLRCYIWKKNMLQSKENISLGQILAVSFCKIPHFWGYFQADFSFPFLPNFRTA